MCLAMLPGRELPCKGVKNRQAGFAGTRWWQARGMSMLGGWKNDYIESRWW